MISTRNPPLIRWFIDNGLDLEEGLPIADAFRYRHREFLGIYLGVRDRVPSARKQAAMALRFHARNGNLKWVSLLLWAGVDPRMSVPDLENSPPDHFVGTALQDAVSYGQLEVVQKIGIDPKKDDPTALLSEYMIGHKTEIVTQLLDAGADPNGNDGKPMANFILSLSWSLDRSVWNTSSEPQLRCIELLASRGGRWLPSDKHDYSCLRRGLAKAPPDEAISHLARVVQCGAMERPVFKELMKTPRMKSLVASSSSARSRDKFDFFSSWCAREKKF